MNVLLIAIASIALSVAAQFSFKAGMSAAEISEAVSAATCRRTLLLALTNKFVIGGFVLYSSSAVAWLGVLSHWDVSKAYPMVGLGFGFTALIGLLG
jgi:hypothetical protein